MHAHIYIYSILRDTTIKGRFADAARARARHVRSALYTEEAFGIMQYICAVHRARARVIFNVRGKRDQSPRI